MCGLAGIYRPLNASCAIQEMERAVRLMTDTLVHRGPDAGGLWADPDGRCVLGHRRLSIIDTSDAGLQPMATADGRFLIAYNGELYNYIALRADLAAAGVQFEGRTDTEVVLQAFATWGVGAFPRFDGMFALAILDRRSGELLLARDPFGEKPLYYSSSADGGLSFASELQAMELAPGIDLEVNVDAMAEMLSFQYIGAPRTIYRSIKKLRPGHWLRIEPSGRTQTGCYFSYNPGAGASDNRPLHDLADELEELLVESIGRRMISDVPLGAFLSGGVDSSTVCALIRRRLGRPLLTFSMGFEGAEESEHLVARKFAEHLGTVHRDKVLSPDVSAFLRCFGEGVDEPNGDSSCLPTFLLSGFAREQVTVAISGDGGDEMFGGYGRYLNMLDQQRRYNSGEIQGWTPGAAYYGNQVLVASEPQIRELFGFVPTEYAHHVGLLRTELNEQQEKLLAAMRRTDVENYMPGAVLPKVDRMSMRHSLEVRTPFLNREIARFSERLPDSVLVHPDRGKVVLKEVAYRYLPRELVDLPKKGFALPMSDWAKDSLLSIAEDMLGDDSRLRETFGSAGISRFVARQTSPGNFSPYQVWAVVSLESWLRSHPAKLPAVAQEQRAGRASIGATVQPERHALFAHPVTSRLFFVSRADADPQIASSEKSPVYLPDHVKIRALELRAEESVAADPASGEAICLPDWDELDGATVAPNSTLDGSVLVFTDDDAGLKLDVSKVERLRQLGARTIVVQNPYIADELVELKLSSFPGKFQIAKLLAGGQRLSTTSLYSLLGARKLRKAEGHAWTSALLRYVDAFPDVELCAEYALFEGMRQLPALPVSHSVIAEEGRGRYSVFDQVVTLAPSGAGREKLVYSLVRVTDENRKLLPMSARRWRPAASPESSMQEALAELAARPGLERRSGSDIQIVLCTHALPPGGAERQWVYLAQGLKELGHDVKVVTFRGLEGVNGHFLPVLEEADIPVIDASKIRPLDQLRGWPASRLAVEQFKLDLIPDREALARLVACFADLRPDTVIAQLDDPNTIGGIAALIARVPTFVMSFRNYNPSNFPYLNYDWYRPAYQAVSRSRDVFLSGNHEGANIDYANWIGVDSARVAEIPNAIDTSEFRRVGEDRLAGLRKELDVDSETPLILGVSRLSGEKDPMTFVEVCARVVSAHPRAKAALAGVGPMRAQLEERIEALGMTGRIMLLGPRSDVQQLMSLATLFLLTSRFEGMPNVVMEAQSIGIPVVATDAGATRLLLDEGNTGFIAPIGDAAGLTDACLRLLTDRTAAARMGEAGRRRMKTSFDKTTMARRYLDLIEGKPGAVAARERERNSKPVQVRTA
jgi:asparagine synthase (glutamine-hydrolysing)